MEYEKLFPLLILAVAVFFTIRAFTALNNLEDRPKGYLTAQVIKAIGFWLVFFASIL